MSEIKQAFILKPLDPDNPRVMYKVLTAIGKKKEKLMHWKLTSIAQRELSIVGLPVTELQTENWIYAFAKSCPEAELTLLAFFIETPAGATPIEALYYNDKLEDEFIDSVTANFIQSLMMLQLILERSRIIELEALVESLNEKIETLLPISSEPLNPSESETAPTSESIATTEPSQESQEPVSA